MAVDIGLPHQSHTSSNCGRITSIPQGCMLTPLFIAFPHTSVISFTTRTLFFSLWLSSDSYQAAAQCSALQITWPLSYQKAQRDNYGPQDLHTCSLPVPCCVKHFSWTELSWADSTSSLVCKTQQQLYFLRRLRRANFSSWRCLSTFTDAPQRETAWQPGTAAAPKLTRKLSSVLWKQHRALLE